MRCLIDGDVLRYEIGFSGEYVDEEGNVQVREFEFVAELLDQKIKEITAECWATEPPTLFLTMDHRLKRKTNKERDKIIKKHKKQLEVVDCEAERSYIEGQIKNEEEAKEHNPNFREAVAQKKEYKGNRKKSKKPFHYDNLTQYIIATYDCEIAEGMEADDLMSVRQYERLKRMDTIICSRDKDLRITPGMHFGWPCGRQPQFGPKRVTDLGEIELARNKIKGDGLKFFYSQVLTGDTVDNIPGLPKCGPVKAYKALADLDSEADLFEAVAEGYRNYYGDDWHDEMNEQCQLLWMVRELTEDGEIVPYVMYDQRS